MLAPGYRAWCLFCYGACFYTALDRAWWGLFLALLPFAGEEAYRRGEL